MAQKRKSSLASIAWESRRLFHLGASVCGERWASHVPLAAVHTERERLWAGDLSMAGEKNAMRAGGGVRLLGLPSLRLSVVTVAD
jgi:hypothetical protein